MLIYFWRDLILLTVSFFKGIASRKPFDDDYSRISWIIIVGSIPAAIVGYTLNDTIDNYFHQGTGGGTAIALIAFLLIALGAVLFLAERLARHIRPMESLGWRDGLIIGCAQALALLPGVSRSGSTITAGLMTGLKRDSAARFSFLLGIPAIVGAGVLETKDMVDTGLSSDQVVTFVTGGVTAAIIGYLAIAFLLTFLRTNSTLVFVTYRFAIGLTVIGLLISGIR